MGISNTTFGLIVFFLVEFVIVSLFSMSGSFASSEVVVDTRFANTVAVTNESQYQADDLSFNTGFYFRDLFSFFFWNISIYSGATLMTYFWIVRLFIVWLPLTMLILSIYYSLPTVNG